MLRSFSGALFQRNKIFSQGIYCVCTSTSRILYFSLVSIFAKRCRYYSVQRNFTCRLFARCKLSYVYYDERCKILVLRRVELRRMKYDITLYFKIVNKFCDTSLINEKCFCNYTYSTCVHKLKFNVQNARTNVFKYFFLNRYITVWNMLPLNCANTNVTVLSKSCIMLICLKTL